MHSFRLNRHSVSFSSIGLIIILGLIFGLQIIMVGPLSVKIPTTPFSIAFRAFISVISFFLCVNLLLFSKAIRIEKGMLWLLVFFFVYTLRFLLDLFIFDIYISPGLGGSARLSQMLYGSIVLPILGICFIRFKKLNLDGYIIYTSLAQSFAILYIFFALYGASLEAFVSRYYVASIFNEFDLGNPIGPIVISRAGGVLALCGLAATNVKNWIKILSFILGVSLLLLGSSRGPLAGFILCTLLLLLKNIRKGTFEVIFLKIVGITICIFVFISLFNLFSGEINLGTYTRLTSMIDSGVSGEERIHTWSAAWSQFVSSPIYGDKIVENYSYTYPHNLVLEVLMSVGLIGFIPFIMASYIAFRRSIYQLKYGSPLVALLFFYMLIGVMVSGGIITSPDFWMTFILILVTPKTT